MSGQFTIQSGVITLTGADDSTLRAFDTATRRESFDLALGGVSSPAGLGSGSAGGKSGTFNWNDSFTRAIKELDRTLSWNNTLERADRLTRVMNFLKMQGHFRLQSGVITLTGADDSTLRAFDTATRRDSFGRSVQH
jgi:glucose dehydrogenase